MTEKLQTHDSPPWSSGTKLVVGLSAVVILGALLVRFSNLIGPLLIAFMLSYLLHPLVSRLSDATRLSWRGSVSLFYLVFVVLIISFFTVTGVAIVDELQNLIRVVTRFVSDLPTLVEDLSVSGWQIGPWTLDISQLAADLNIDFLAVSEQILSVLQPLLGQAGGLLGSLALSGLTTLGWGAFVLVISYFILTEAGQVPDLLKNVELPGHDYDLRRLGRELGRIWNAFLRGQFMLFVMVIVATFALLSILGVRNALGLAFLAGLAKFVPYVGPVIAGITTALVAFFQAGNYLGLEPLPYALVVVVLAVVLDQVFDNLITPRIYGQTLGVHPAAVLVAAIIAASMIGFVGLLLAAPVLASLQLFGRYTIRKMVDQDPWPYLETELVEISFPLEKQFRQLRVKVRDLFTKRGK